MAGYFFQLGSLSRNRGGIASIAFEHLRRDGAAVHRAEQPGNDLQLPSLAMPVCAAGCPLARSTVCAAIL